MKTVKIILLLATVSLFTSMPYSAAEARDCSNPKGFHEKLMCRVSGETDRTVTSNDTEKKGESLKTKIEKKGDSLWQKMQNFGGKKIGESD